MSKSKHLPALDGIRGIAVILVVLVHYWGGAHSHNLIVHVVGEAVKVGWSGVSLFFVLSGFLITGILWDSRATAHWWRNFYMRRTLRIFPLYYASLLLMLVGGAFVGAFRECLSGAWVYALYLQNMPWLSAQTVQVNHSPLWIGHFWSLAVEEQFYLIWPFLLSRMKTLRQARNLCLAVFLLSALFRVLLWAFSANPLAYSAILPVRCGELALGGFLAICFRGAEWPRIQSWAPGAMVLSFAGLVSVLVYTHDLTGDTRDFNLYGLPCLAIFLGAFLVMSLGKGMISQLAKTGWLRWLGGISYGVYVYHVLLRNFYEHLVHAIAPNLGHNANDVLVAGVGMSCTITVSWLSYRYFETPFLRLKDRFKVEIAPGQPMVAAQGEDSR